MFQKKIIEKYLSKIDRELLIEKYALYRSIFANEEKQENIRNSKEEQYQEGFIRDLFCSVLGYTIKPEANYNILTELKNESKSNSKKSDGAIIINNEVKAVIELKGTDTQDLDKVAFQAFSYKNHHEKCNYVIVSNFERLRLYVETQIEYTEFNLFHLSKDSFDLLYLLLQLENITNDIPLKLKHETLTEEKEITNNFYSDYSTFKRALFEDLIENNPEIDKLLLFKKTQKLLDRILFILFCEDKNLLPTNSTMGIINDYKKLKELGYYQPLYNVFKTFFDRIDKGFKHDTDKSKDVFAYNGGLFKPDETLDSVKVGDDVLYIHAQRLANYDFQSQISVDILGRIFENSLTEIEEVQNEIENEKNGIKTDNNNIGKRKKDGVFYTPEYITKYIVENTIGKLCEAKKEELKINDSEYTFDKKFQKRTIEQLDDRLNKYREWLLNLKILDCACGSGAFLNSALKELRKEHTLIDYFWSKIHKNELNFSQIDNSILENNLYGVDINEDSIEITKLSLWLNTATRNRKLTTLNDKIKCGNSLIDDESIAGEKAFNWKKEFPEVFEKGGFDVIIGNPPYVRVQQLDYKIIDYLKTRYKTALKRIDLSLCFIEKSKELIKDSGITAFITSNQFLTTEYGQAMREFLLNEYFIKDCIDFGDLPIFADALTYVSIFSFTKEKQDSFNYYNIKDLKTASSGNFGKPETIELNKLNTSNWNLAKFQQQSIFDKLKINSVDLGSIGNAGSGLFTGLDDVLMFSKEELNNYDFEKEMILPVLRAENCTRFFCNTPETFVIYPYKYENGKTIVLTEEELKEKYPKTYDYLLSNKELLGKRKDSRKTFADRKDWFSLTRFGQKNIFNKNKIVSQGEVKNHKFSIDYSKSGFSCARVFAITINNENEFDLNYILCILNSNVMKSFLQSISSLKSGGYYSYSSNILNRTPIKKIGIEEQKPFIELSEKMLSLNSELQKKANNFLKIVKQTFNIEKVSSKLESFYDLDFEDFIKELKQKITPKIKLDWLELFEEQKKTIIELKQEIDKTDKEINSLVYSLYNLTDEEIKIIEG